MYDDSQDRFMGGPVAPPEPFTQADNLELQRLQAGVAGARKALYDGEIDDQTHAAYQRELMGRMAPLAERQRQAQQQMQQMETMQAMHQHALQQAVEQQASQFRAQGLNQRVATYTDPMTGKTAHLIEDGQGKVREIDFGEPQDHLPLHAALSMGEGAGESGGAAPSPYVSDAQDPADELAQRIGQPAPATPAPEPAPQWEGSSSGGSTEGPVHPATPLDKPFEQVIYNGGKRTVTRWAGDGTPGKIIEGGPPAGSAAAQELEAAGRAPGEMATPALAQWAREQANPPEKAGQDDVSLTKEEMATEYNRADASIPRLMGALANNPHAQLARQQAVLTRTEHALQNRLTVKRHIQAQGAQGASQEKRIEAQKALQEQRQQAVKERKEKEENWAKEDVENYEHARKNLMEGRPKDNPGPAPTHDEIEAEAEKIRGYRENQRQYRRTQASKAAGQTAAPANAPAPAPKTAEERQGEADRIKAELAKRSAAPQQPQAKDSGYSPLIPGFLRQ